MSDEKIYVVHFVDGFWIGVLESIDDNYIVLSNPFLVDLVRGGLINCLCKSVTIDRKSFSFRAYGQANDEGIKIYKDAMNDIMSIRTGIVRPNIKLVIDK